MEGIYMSIDRWMDKEDVVHTHNEYYSATKKLCTGASPNEIDEPRAYYTE